MDSSKEFMTPTGKHNKFVITNPNVFNNSECLFVEFHDVINATWLALVLYLRETKLLENIINTEKLKNFKLDKMYIWYCLRNNRNALIDLIREKNKDNINTAYMAADEGFYKFSYCYDKLYRLNFSEVLSIALTKKKLIKRFVIYNEVDIPYIRDIVHNEFKGAEFICGDLYDVIKDIPRDSTYVFSDVTKVQVLCDVEKLDYSSIILSEPYKYNHIGAYNSDELLVDINKLMKDHLFKFNAFYNIPEEVFN